MASLFKMHRVEHECSCLRWMSLCDLYFCGHCSAFRCQSCSKLEIDAIFCPNCLENSSMSESRLKKNRCPTCNQCPICEGILTTKASGEMCHLVCSTCTWSTRDSDICEQKSGVNWPIHDSTVSEELNKVIDQLQGLAASEKSLRDQALVSKRRSTNIGSHLPDRYGLQTIYSKRKKTMEKPVVQVPEHKATEEVPNFDINDFIESSTDIPSFDTLIKQPLVSGKPIRPVRVPLRSRKAVRCNGCQYHISKWDFGPCTTKTKVQHTARLFAPEIRLARQPDVTPGTVHVLLSVANESMSLMDILIMPDNQEGYVECLTPLIELHLPPSDEAADLCEPASAPMDETNNIVYRKRHRAVVRLEVKKIEKDVLDLGLLVKFQSEISVEGEKRKKWNIVRTKIHLDDDL